MSILHVPSPGESTSNTSDFRSSRPHLPAKFLDELLSLPMMEGFQSAILLEQFHFFRRLIAKGHEPDSLFERERCKGRPLPLLHHGVELADPPLVCEMIRAGATVDKRMEGSTPLMRTLQLIGCYTYEIQRGELPADDPDLNKEIQRLTFIARILLEQHSDVTLLTVEGYSLLHLACAIPDFGLIELLLHHGTDPSILSPQGTPASRVFPESQRPRLISLIDSIPPTNPRPLQLCPCFSGETLLACHAAGPQPYPSEFLCRCGSEIQRTYGDCDCSVRLSTFFIETWDSEQRWIQPSMGLARSPPIGDGASPTYEQIVVDHLEKQSKVDRAYRFAVYQVKELVVPQDRSSPRSSAGLQDRWNTAVDDYIKFKTDERSKEEIERAAKIGPSWGPLHRMCEGEGCLKVERKDLKRLKACTKCYLSVYCDQVCQASAWKNHKKVCGTSEQREQALPSQIEVAAFLLKAQRIGLFPAIGETFDMERLRLALEDDRQSP